MGVDCVWSWRAWIAYGAGSGAQAAGGRPMASRKAANRCGRHEELSVAARSAPRRIHAPSHLGDEHRRRRRRRALSCQATPSRRRCLPRRGGVCTRPSRSITQGSRSTRKNPPPPCARTRRGCASVRARTRARGASALVAAAPHGEKTRDTPTSCPCPCPSSASESARRARARSSSPRASSR